MEFLESEPEPALRMDLTKYEGLPISSSTLSNLDDPEKPLEQSLFDFFMTFLLLDSEPPKDFAAFGTPFFSDLSAAIASNLGLSSLSKWAPGTTLLEKKVIFFCIFDGGHYSIIVVLWCCDEKKIYFFHLDSGEIKHDSNEIFTKLKKYLSYNLALAHIDLKNFYIETSVVDVPKHNRAENAGVYALYFLDSVLKMFLEFKTEIRKNFVKIYGSIFQDLLYRWLNKDEAEQYRNDMYDICYKYKVNKDLHDNEKRMKKILHKLNKHKRKECHIKKELGIHKVDDEEVCKFTKLHEHHDGKTQTSKRHCFGLLDGQKQILDQHNQFQQLQQHQQRQQSQQQEQQEQEELQLEQQLAHQQEQQIHSQESGGMELEKNSQSGYQELLRYLRAHCQELIKHHTDIVDASNNERIKWDNRQSELINKQKALEKKIEALMEEYNHLQDIHKQLLEANASAQQRERAKEMKRLQDIEKAKFDEFKESERMMQQLYDTMKQQLEEMRSMQF